MLFLKTQGPNLHQAKPESENRKEFYALYNEDDADFTQHARLDYPFHNGKYSVVATCNGLLFLSKEVLRGDYSFCLWNPCVGKSLKLPSPNITYATHGKFRDYLGFGFDPKTKDYKVIRVVTLLESLDFKRTRPQVEIYTLSTGQWRMLGTGLAPLGALYSTYPHTFINGALHWVAFFRDSDNNIHNFVLVFDLGEEVFHEILLPEFPGHMGLISGTVSVYRNSIAFFRKDFFAASDSTERALGFRRNGEFCSTNSEDTYCGNRGRSGNKRIMDCYSRTVSSKSEATFISLREPMMAI
nr:putative f-box protein [Quercus suber]